MAFEKSQMTQIDQAELMNEFQLILISFCCCECEDD
jgi:hypothetical protein